MKSHVCTFVGGPKHGERLRIPANVTRVAVPLDPEHPGESCRSIYYLRARFSVAATKDIFFFVLEGLSQEAQRAAFAKLQNPKP